MLIYITGVAGSGKSTVYEELLKRGLEAYDGENHKEMYARYEDGMYNRYGKLTGKKNTKPRAAYLGYQTRKWLDNHECRISKKSVEQMVKETEGRTAFLVCGVAANIVEVRSLFAQVFCLTVDEEALRCRLTSRKSPAYGQAAEELRHILGLRVAAENSLRQLGTVIVDATQPVNVIVNEILARLEVKRS